MHETARNTLAWLTSAVLWSLVSAPAGAQCVNIAEGNVLVVDLTGADPIIKVTDTEKTADITSNQEIVCTGGPITFPRSIDFDCQGRIWVSMSDGAFRVDPSIGPLGQQIKLVTGQLVPQRGILKQRHGPVFLADPGLVNLATILLVDNLNGLLSPFTQLGSTGVPLGLIFDPAAGAIVCNDPQAGDNPLEMLLADSGNSFLVPAIAAGLYAINAAGGVRGIARNGVISIPYRLDSDDVDFVYLSDLGGLVDPDGNGPLPAEPQPPQVVRVDRSIAFDFEDNEADGRVNQTVISRGCLFSTPIGIVILEPDVLLVADATAGGGSLIRVDFDPSSPDPDDCTAQTIVAQGLFFDTPWEVKIVPAIEPLPRRRIFVTNTDDSVPADSGIVYIDPDGSSGNYVTGFTTPTAVVVDPNALDDLIVADAAVGGTPSIQRVTPTSPGASSGIASEISSGGLLLEPTGIVVDAAGDILVVDRSAKQVLRIDGSTGAQTLLSPIGATTDFFVEPVGLGIDFDGYVQVVDQGAGLDPPNPRVIRINPISGKQFCIAQGGIPGSPLSLDGIQDIIFDPADSSSVFSVQNIPPILRFIPGVGSLFETTSLDYEAIRQTAIAENRDLLSVDAGDPAVPGDGRVWRLDPIISPVPGDPTLVAGSENLADPRGIAVEGIPRPNPSTADSDSDGILDPEDNCVDVANPDQTDAGGTLAGDACDLECDFSGDGVIGLPDFALLVPQIGIACADLPEGEVCADCASPTQKVPDGIVGLPDFLAFLPQIGQTVPGAVGGLVGISDDVCP